MGRGRRPIPVWVDILKLAATTPLPGWQHYAACRDHTYDIFYVSGSGPRLEVQRMCGACPVRYACLASLLNEEGEASSDWRYGFRAATRPSERVAMHDAVRAHRRENAA